MSNSSSTATEKTLKKAKDVEVDLFEFVKKLWLQRRYIVKLTSLFVVFGVFIAIFSPKEYTSSITMVPQLGDSKPKVNGLAGLAAMAGFNLNDITGGEVLPPTIYPQIMESVTFKKDLMYTKVKFQNIPTEITLYDYYTNPDYQSFNLLNALKKYTIGLPGVIFKAIKGENKSQEKKIAGSERYILFSPKESKVSKLLAAKVKLAVNEKEGTLFLTANMPEALVSTQVAEAARILLQKYITNFKIDKVRQNLEFVGQRYLESKEEYLRKQQQLAAFQDANRNVILASTRTVQDRIANDYSLAYSVYSELAKQYEQAKIKVKDATPVLTVIEPAYIPDKTSKPKRIMMVMASFFIGFVVSSLIVLNRSSLTRIKKIFSKEG